MGRSFRHSAGFGKRMEYSIIGRMLMEGLDCYVPLVDDHGVDCVIKKGDGTFIEVQIKARSSEVAEGDAALFSAITHELRENFYFVFYSERLDLTWILSSEEFLKECVTNKTGKNAGKKSIWFNGNKIDEHGIKKEYCKPQFEKYICNDFSRFYCEKEQEVMKSTEQGFVNKNKQRNNGRTQMPGTDNQQWFYDMECLGCGHKYYANGSDIWQRKCPKCQGGRP